MPAGLIKTRFRFDDAGRLDADFTLTIPRTELPKDLELDRALAEQLAHEYFETVRQSSFGLYKPQFQPNSVRVRTLLGKTVLLFVDTDYLIAPGRAEVSWRLAGGFMLAHRVTYGGRFFLGAEQSGDGQTLILYARLRKYPSRLFDWFGRDLGELIYSWTQRRSQNYFTERYLERAAEWLHAQKAAR